MSNLIFLVFPSPETNVLDPAEGISPCTLEKCPNCGKNCWMSEKKKEILFQCQNDKVDAFIACYSCFKGKLDKNPEALKYFLESEILRI